YEGFRLRYGQSFLGSLPTEAERNGDFSDFRDSSGNLLKIYDPTTTALNPDGSYIRQQIGCRGRLNVICPESINPTARAMLAKYPLPTMAGNQFTHVNNYALASSGGGNNDEFTARVDRNVSDKQHLFGRYTLWKIMN